MKKILITGAAGNIGYELQRDFQDNIVLLDKKNINYYCIHKKVKLDLTDYIKVKNFFKENTFDIIIHLAATSRVRDAENAPRETFRHNVKATKNILKAISLSKQYPHIIFSSSREVYGEIETDTPFKENSACKPQNVYGKSKLKAEHILQNYSQKHNIPVIILRLANVYGGIHDNKQRFIPQLLEAKKTGKQFILYGNNKYLDFVHIEDVVYLIKKFIHKKTKKETSTTFAIYNIATGKSYNLEEIVKIFFKNNKKHYIINNGEKFEVEKVKLDNTKICKEFNYRFKEFKKELFNLQKENINLTGVSK